MVAQRRRQVGRGAVRLHRAEAGSERNRPRSCVRIAGSMLARFKVPKAASSSASCRRPRPGRSRNSCCATWPRRTSASAFSEAGQASACLDLRSCRRQRRRPARRATAIVARIARIAACRLQHHGGNHDQHHRIVEPRDLQDLAADVERGGRERRPWLSSPSFGRPSA